MDTSKNRPLIHNLQVDYRSLYHNVVSNISTFIIAGFHPIGSMFRSPYDDFEGHEINIVMPNRSLPFANVYIYPDKSQVRAGADYLAALYFGRALNFKPK